MVGGRGIPSTDQWIVNRKVLSGHSKSRNTRNVSEHLTKGVPPMSHW